MSTDLNDVIAALVERTRVVEAHEHEPVVFPATDKSWMSWRVTAPGLGRYHFSVPFGSTSTFAVTASWIYAVPFFTPEAATVTKIGIYKTAGVAGKHARMGIYNNGSGNFPGTLLSDAGASAGFAGIGAEVVQITGLSIPLAAQSLYWLAIDCDWATTFQAFAMTQAWGLMGYPTPDISVETFGMWAKAQAYGALPDPFTGVLTAPAAGMLPLALGVFI